MTETEAYEQYKKTSDDALDEASKIKITISGEGAAYQRQYIADTVAKVSSALERLNDLSMQLTKIALQTRRIQMHYNTQLKKVKAETLASADYAALPVMQREQHLLKAVTEATKSYEAWDYLLQYVTEVKTAIAERSAMIRRLDSDLRLHSKLLEVTSDEIVPHGPSFAGFASQGTEIDF